MRKYFAIVIGLAASLIVTSCGVNNPATIPPEKGKLVLSVDNNMIANDSIASARLTVKFEGKVVTQSADGVEILRDGVVMSGDIFKSTTDGTYEFVAKYDGKESNKVTIKVGAISKVLRRNGVIFDVTSTGCTYCPIGANALKAAKNEIGVGLYTLFFHVMFGSPVDPFAAGFSNDVQNWMGGGSGYPFIRMNNSTTFANGSFDALDIKVVLAENGGKADVGIAISTNFNKSTGNLKCTINSKMDSEKYKGQELRMVAWLTQDSLVAPQLNMGTISRDYVHQDVVIAPLLKAETGEDVCKGEIIPNEYINVADKEYTKEFTYEVPADCNPKHTYVNAYVYHKISGDKGSTANDTIMNIQRVRIGEQVPYVYR